MKTAEEYYQLGVKYKNAQQFPESMENFEKAIALNHTGAMVWMARYYTLGRAGVIEKDEAKAMELSRRALELGDSAACFNFHLLTRRRGDIAESFNWLRRGSRMGHGYCRFLVGLAYYKGESGVKENRRTALRYFRRAAAMGETSALLRLADMYRRGPLRHDEAKAVYLYGKAAVKGNKNAMHELAVIYQHSDPERSRFWEEKSGDPIGSIVWAFSRFIE